MSDQVGEASAAYLRESGQLRQQLFERIQRILERLPDPELQDLPSLDDLGLLGEIESRLATQAVSQNAMGRALLRGHKARTQLIRSTDMLSIDQVAQLLGIQSDSVRKRIQRGRLLAVKQGSSMLLPAFQLRDNQVIGGLGECLDALKSLGDWTRLDWFMMPHPDLDEQTPAECLVTSPELVIAAARRFGRHGGA